VPSQDLNTGIAAHLNFRKSRHIRLSRNRLIDRNPAKRGVAGLPSRTDNRHTSDDSERDIRGPDGADSSKYGPPHLTRAGNMS
jgi:hypothetical protein